MKGSKKTFCNRCAFHRGGCVLGNTLKKATKCNDYIPLCVSCPYPDLFCTTCSLRDQNELKDGMVADKELGNHMYACVWDTSPAGSLPPVTKS